MRLADISEGENAILAMSELKKRKFPKIQNRNLKFYPLNYRGRILNISELPVFSSP